MTPAARISAAIEVLTDIDTRHRPAADALKDWGLSHRFAGSGDRATIASLVYDALRRRASSAWIMGGETPRAVVAGMLRLQRGLTGEGLAALFSGARFAPEPLTADELARLDAADLSGAPDHVAGDYPEWVGVSLAGIFGDDIVAEARALGERAPFDLRVNTLKATREDVLAELTPFGAAPTPWSPLGLRIPLGEDGRGPSIQSDPVFLRGEVEIQDEGSQLAALLSAAAPGESVVDLCAGGGGKTLALAALMKGEGRLTATDSDPRRLAPIHARLARAGVTAEIRTPRGSADPVADLGESADLVLVDAPCTGTGTWRRNPDAKWRLRPGSLAGRVRDQATVLDRAVRLVRPGGRIVYVTCSVLPEENDEAVASALSRHPGLAADRMDVGALEPAIRRTRCGIQMSPARTGTDGFYVSRIRRDA